MKTGISLTALAQKIEAQKELKNDFIASTNKLSVEIDSDKTPLLFLPRAGAFNDQRLPILPLAHRQIAVHTGIPAQYYTSVSNCAGSRSI